jgi:hypothetical protein
LTYFPLSAIMSYFFLIKIAPKKHPVFHRLNQHITSI